MMGQRTLGLVLKDNSIVGSAWQWCRVGEHGAGSGLVVQLTQDLPHGAVDKAHNLALNVWDLCLLDNVSSE